MTLSVLFGYAAEFDDPGKLVEAAQAALDAGYSKFETYSPYPIKELDEIMPGINPLPPIVFFGGLTGTATAWIMQWYIAGIDFPTNIGGRPLYSWPSFVPITFELTVLFASIAAFLGALALCGLPCLHHPLFNERQFARATNDRFFLCIESRDRKFSIDTTADFLAQFEPMKVWEIERE